jgi:hypothetical protein
MNQFVEWDPCSVKDGAVLTNLQGVDRVFALDDGESVVNGFPQGAHFRFDPEFKRDTLPVDFYINVDSMMVCSNRAKEFISASGPEAVEYLPVTVFDHKGKALAERHWIVHPINPPDCIDLASSKVTWSSLDPDSIQRFRHLELDAARVPAARQLFRPKACPRLLALRRPFAEALVQQGFSGARWKEIK